MDVTDANRLAEPATDQPLRFEALRHLGLLWLINTTVFHPRGLALTFLYPQGADIDEINAGHIEPVAWELQGNRTERWTFGCDERTATTCDNLYLIATEFMNTRGT